MNAEAQRMPLKELIELYRFAKDPEKRAAIKHEIIDRIRRLALVNDDEVRAVLNGWEKS